MLGVLTNSFVLSTDEDIQDERKFSNCRIYLLILPRTAVPDSGKAITSFLHLTTLLKSCGCLVDLLLLKVVDKEFIYLILS